MSRRGAGPGPSHLIPRLINQVLQVFQIPAGALSSGLNAKPGQTRPPPPSCPRPRWIEGARECSRLRVQIKALSLTQFWSGNQVRLPWIRALPAIVIIVIGAPTPGLSKKTEQSLFKKINLRRAPGRVPSFSMNAEPFHLHFNPICCCFSLPCQSTVCGFAPNLVLK